jgi:hypothetical protein
LLVLALFGAVGVQGSCLFIVLFWGAAFWCSPCYPCSAMMVLTMTRCFGPCVSPQHKTQPPVTRTTRTSAAATWLTLQLMVATALLQEKHARTRAVMGTGVVL